MLAVVILSLSLIHAISAAGCYRSSQGRFFYDASSQCYKGSSGRYLYKVGNSWYVGNVCKSSRSYFTRCTTSVWLTSCRNWKTPRNFASSIVWTFNSNCGNPPVPQPAPFPRWTPRPTPRRTVYSPVPPPPISPAGCIYTPPGSSQRVCNNAGGAFKVPCDSTNSWKRTNPLKICAYVPGHGRLTYTRAGFLYGKPYYTNGARYIGPVSTQYWGVKVNEAEQYAALFCAYGNIVLNIKGMCPYDANGGCFQPGITEGSCNGGTGSTTIYTPGGWTARPGAFQDEHFECPFESIRAHGKDVLEFFVDADAKKVGRCVYQWQTQIFVYRDSEQWFISSFSKAGNLTAAWFCNEQDLQECRWIKNNVNETEFEGDSVFLKMLGEDFELQVPLSVETTEIPESVRKQDFMPFVAVGIVGVFILVCGVLLFWRTRRVKKEVGFENESEELEEEPQIEILAETEVLSETIPA